MRFLWWFPKTRRSRKTRPHSPHSPQSRPFSRPEELETRDLLTVFAPGAILEPTHGSASPFGSVGPTGLSPAQVRHAYGFDQVAFGGTAGTGAGATIAIVDAYDDPSIQTDLHAFDQQFGLPDPTFTKVNQSGGTTMPAANTGWAGEISLDVEWAHAVAPAANILLVEAASSSLSNLFTAVDYAARQPGVAAVSMSWGGGEFSGESSYDSNFVTPAGHSGVVFLASSGDYGAPVSYPAASPNVVSVGGTTLSVDSQGNYLGESGWGGSGGGVSGYEAQPAYQAGVVTQTTTRRANPDVAYDADPNTGFSVYQTYGNSTTAPWLQYGGTSAAAPQWAGLVAVADQGRALAGEAALSSATLLPMLYQLPAADFHDTTSGTSTGSPNYTAGPGYDLVTGRGTPVANRVVADLVGSTTITPTATHFAVSAPTGTTAGAGFAVTVTALDANNRVVSGYTGTLHFSSSDPAAVLPPDYTFTAADSGAHTFTITLKTAGSQSLAATDTSTGSMTGTASGITVTPAAATHLGFLQQPTAAVAGAAISPAVRVALLDQYGNIVTTDNTDAVTLAFGSNPSGAALSGGGPVTVVQGVATFTGLSVNNAGTGYTLAASSGTLAGATSAAFNVSATTGGTTGGSVVEDFQAGLGNYWYTGNSYPYAHTSTAAAHDGTAGFDDVGDGDWYFRTDAAAQVNPGDTVSVWVKFAGAADGRAYFGFGTGTGGTLSVVLAPNTGQLLIQNNAGFGFTDLAAVPQSFAANQWYRVEVDWGTSGAVTAKLFAGSSQTPLNAVSAATGDITPGGFAFRATGHDKYFDTVTVTRGVNQFTLAPPEAFSAPTRGTAAETGTTHGSSSPATRGHGPAVPWVFGAEARHQGWGHSESAATVASGHPLNLAEEWFIEVG